MGGRVKGHLPVNADRPITGIKGPKNAPIIRSLGTQTSSVANVTGITISPKKNFCIIKIWMSNCANQNPAIVTNLIPGLIPQGCIFKKHTPEY
jgi:hypothetical protein